jgi:putative ABC transport system permease protein
MVTRSGNSVLRPELSFPVVLMVVGVAVAGAVLAAAWPAWRASRMRPVEALRSV